MSESLSMHGPRGRIESTLALAPPAQAFGAQESDARLASATQAAGALR